MSRRVLVVAALACAVWGVIKLRGGSPQHVDTIVTERVLHDLARDNARILYHTDRDGLSTRFDQQDLATFDVGHGTATIATKEWTVSVELDRVTEVVCERRHIHWPEPGHVLLDVAFRNGPEDEDGHAPELLRVQFEQGHEVYFQALCDRHKLRKIGDFAH